MIIGIPKRLSPESHHPGADRDPLLHSKSYFFIIARRPEADEAIL
jgi:hypothetical protein